MTSWELSECRLREGDGVGEGEEEERGLVAEPERVCPPLSCTSASLGGALRLLLTKDGRMPAPGDALGAQPGGRLSDFALRR